MAKTSTPARPWWESKKVRGIEALGILVAIATGVGGLALSTVSYSDQREREQERLASGVVLVPARERVLLQNYGELPVVDLSLHVGEQPGVLIGTLAPCYAVDVTPHVQLYEGRDPDGDGVMEGGRDVVIQYQDAAGRLWWREGLVGNSKSVRGAMSEAHEGRAEAADVARLANPLPVPTRIDGCG